MRNFLYKLGLFFLIVFLVDFISGVALQYMNDHSRGGGIKSRYYIAKESNEDVIVFGSSRARHHYVPDIIEEQLGLHCYNAGMDGNGIIYNYGVLKMITQRYIPKIIIYDLYYVYDIAQDDNMKYLDFLKPYYYEPGIDSIFWSVNPKTRIMMQSDLYRFNTSCVKILGSYMSNHDYSPNGYRPLYKTKEQNQETTIERYETKDKTRLEEDCLKILYFDKFIQLARDKKIDVVVCISPFYQTDFNIDYTSIQQILDKYNVPLLSFSQDSFICNDNTLFQDNVHMNDNGARLFTLRLCSELIHSK